MAAASFRLPGRSLEIRDRRPALASSVCLCGTRIHRGAHPESFRRYAGKSAGNQSLPEGSPVPDALGDGPGDISISGTGGLPDNFPARTGKSELLTTDFTDSTDLKKGAKAPSHLSSNQ